MGQICVRQLASDYVWQLKLCFSLFFFVFFVFSRNVLVHVCCCCCCCRCVLLMVLFNVHSFCRMALVRCTATSSSCVRFVWHFTIFCPIGHVDSRPARVCVRQCAPAHILLKIRAKFAWTANKNQNNKMKTKNRRRARAHTAHRTRTRETGYEFGIRTAEWTTHACAFLMRMRRSTERTSSQFYTC